MRRELVDGALAGAAGTAVLNAVTYLDMALRGRPASSTPEQSVETLSEKAGVPIPGDEDTRSNRVAGLGPLLGTAAGVGVGALYGGFAALAGRPRVGWGGVLAGTAAMVLTNAPMTGLGLTDPRTWSANAWVSDAVPHVAYGAVTAVVYDRMAR